VPDFRKPMGPSMTIRLTDSELDAVMAAARPIAVERRDAFLQDVAAELAALPMLGAGAVHRAIAMVQRRHFDPPNLAVGGQGRSSKYR